MKLKPFVLVALLALAVTGFAQADSDRFANPTTERLLSLTSEHLALTTAQQDRLRPLLQRAAALRSEIRNRNEALRAASRHELARSDADLRALSRERQAQVAEELKAVDDLRQQFLAFYQNVLNPDQQARARQLMVKRLERIDRLRQRMMAFSDAAASSP